MVVLLKLKINVFIKCVSILLNSNIKVKPFLKILDEIYREIGFECYAQIRLSLIQLGDYSSLQVIPTRLLRYALTVARSFSHTPYHYL